MKNSFWCKMVRIRTVSELGQALRQARRAKGLTQVELAALAGIQPHHISNIENGATNPTASTILTLLAALELDWQFNTRSKDTGIGDIF
ncbi:helix-turn-helix domain-containing protein [Paracoccus ravus]|uniref:helix-turn-helix domain-containing protein n=1 Tax=Paracoccus ravus TaxID=2447760 RepID=UPI001FD6C9BB|nr:helix-turn-helix transcriptional regulator [Paracoccus ravus]